MGLVLQPLLPEIQVFASHSMLAVAAIESQWRSIVLTRQMIMSGQYLDSFDTLPDSLRWDQARIFESMTQTLSWRPADGEVWIFGYGSLMWNPMLDFDQRVVASLEGWQRSFCIRMIASRGSPQTPGRMLALEPGGVTHGVAYRLNPLTADEELRVLWTREMPTGAYRPIWAYLTLEDGREITAIVFVADPKCALYECESSISAVAPMVAAAQGPFGSNCDYVLKLEAALTLADLHDPYVAELADVLRVHRV
jgi:cation transport protein ChaC